jgi:hypothetical protein
MSDPNTTPGHSTKFEFGDAATYAISTTWTEIAQILEIGPPEVEADDIETSNMQSPEQFKTFDPGWADAGEIEVTLQYEKAEAVTLYGLFRIKKGFRMTFEDTSKWSLNGYIKKFGGEIDREGVITQTITVKVSGKPVFAAAAPA